MAEKKTPKEGTAAIGAAELKAQIRAELLAELKLEKDTAAKTSKTKPKVNPYLEELVEITLFRDNGKYKDDVYVSINDEPAIAIKRGVPVKIKRKYALILEQSLRQDMEAVQFIENAVAETKKRLAEM